MGIWYRSRTSRTPEWAIPRANPPPNANPILTSGSTTSLRPEPPRSAVKKLRTARTAALITPPWPLPGKSRFRRRPVVEWTSDGPDEQVHCQVPSVSTVFRTVLTVTRTTQLFGRRGDRTVAPQAERSGHGPDDRRPSGRRAHRSSCLFCPRAPHADGLSLTHAR